jgi:hypothetical protein
MNPIALRVLADTQAPDERRNRTCADLRFSVSGNATTQALADMWAAVSWSRPQWFDPLNVPKSDQISRLPITFLVVKLHRGR